MTDPNDELARLAQQGQARLAEAQHGQASAADKAADRNVRVAVGGVRGAPLQRVLMVLGVLCGAATAAGWIWASSAGPFTVMNNMPILMPGIFVTSGLIVLARFLPPLATRAAVEAERAWVAALPFRLENYFNVIGARPEPECCLEVQLETAQPLARETLQGVIALFDTRSTVLEASGRQLRFRTGPISGSTGMAINRVSVNRNHRLGKAVHRLVDVVLLPIHRSDPVTRVWLSRGYGR